MVVLRKRGQKRNLNQEFENDEIALQIPLPKKRRKTPDSDLLKKFHIKPCQVKLDNMTFTKMQLKCKAKSLEGEDLQCDIVQTDTNSFCIKIKRKKSEIFNEHCDQMGDIVGSIPILDQMSDMVQSIPNTYSLRERKMIKKVREPPKKCTTVATISVNGQKEQLWARCKKKSDKSKLVEGALVFAKQVPYP